VRARADLTSQADVYTAEAELARAELSLVEAQNAMAVGKVRLDNATGLGRTAPDYTLADGLTAEAPSEPIPTYLDRAMSQRPDLRLFEEQARAAGAVITQAESDYWPTVGAVGGLNARGHDDQAASNYYAGVTLSWPLFNGFATDHEVAQARLQQEAVRHDIQDLRLDITEQVERAYLDCRAARERITRAERAVAAARLQLELADRRYAAGLGTIIEVVEADRQSTEADALHVGARADLVIARAALARNTGEGPQP
jgi:outer membrane protein